MLYECRIGHDAGVHRGNTAAYPLYGADGKALVIRAHDRDAGNNALLQYRIVSTKGREGSMIRSRFTVDEHTGAILRYGGVGLFDHGTPTRHRFEVGLWLKRKIV